jgi:hypothetical protein
MYAPAPFSTAHSGGYPATLLSACNPRCLIHAVAVHSTAPSSGIRPRRLTASPAGMRPASYPFMPIHLATPPPGSTFASPMDLHGRRGGSMPAHHFMPPHRLSRTHLYSPNGVFPHGHVAHGHVAVPAGMAYPPPMHPSPTSYLRRARPPTRSVDAPESSDGGYSSESKSKFKPRKNNSEPKVGADGMPRLNARCGCRCNLCCAVHPAQPRLVLWGASWPWGFRGPEHGTHACLQAASHPEAGEGAGAQGADGDGEQAAPESRAGRPAAG